MNPLLRITTSASALAAVLALTACERPGVAPPPPTAVFVTTIGSAAADEERRFTATVQARVETELAFRSGGKVTQRLVDVGSRVAAGQPLVRLDTADGTLAMAAAADQLKAASVEAGQAASDEARLRRLLADGAVGAADHERQNARAEAAAARVDLARSQFELARHRLSYTTLTAPYAGIVTSIRLEAGQVVAEGQAVLTLAADGEREVVADVPETLVADVRGYQARAGSWGKSAAPVDLQMRELAPVATAQGGTYRVKYAPVAATRAALAQLPLGSSVQLTLSRTAQRRTSLPPAALVKGSGAAGVWAIDARGTGLQFVPVEVVGHDAEAVDVKALAAGLRVVTVGAQKLDASMTVRPIERARPEAVDDIARSLP